MKVRHFARCRAGRRFLRTIFYSLFSIFCAAGSIAAQSRGEDPRALAQKLNALRVDGEHVYRVRELILRRDAVRIGLDEGKLAFLGALDGRVTGAVFSGEGRVIAVPRDPVEKASLIRFLGAPLLDQSFTRAYFRFTDNTAEELSAQIARAGAQPFAEPTFAEDWNPTVANLNPVHSLRILTDLLAREPQAHFYAGIAGDASGAFEVMVDNRRAEQIRIGQMRFVEGREYFDTWASFSRADQPPPVPSFELVTYSIETTIPPSRALDGTTALQLKTVRAGERVVPLEISKQLSVAQVMDEAGRVLPFFETNEIAPEEAALRGDHGVLVALPEAPAAGQTLRLRVKYHGNLPTAGAPPLSADALGSWYARLAGSDKSVPFELSFRWPRRFTLAATGKKLEEHEDGEWRSGRWASEGLVPSARFVLDGASWGDEIPRGGYRDEWIAVGLDGYRALMAEETTQPGRLAAQLESYRRKLTAPEGENETLDSIGPLALGYRLRSSKSPRGYEQLAPPKAVWVFHMLRAMLQSAIEPPAADGDRFEKLLKALATNYRARAITTADFQREVETVMTPEMDLEGTRKTTGRPGAMDWFFDQWVRGTGIPRYSVEFEVTRAGDRTVVRGKLKQSGVPASFIAAVPIYATHATDAAGAKPVLLGTVVTSGEETSFQFTARARPNKLLIDPQQTLLCLTE